MAIEWPIGQYWLVCAAVAVLLLWRWPVILSLLSPKPSSAQGEERALLIIGWTSTSLAALNYVMHTQKLAPGSYSLPDLVVFSLCNGCLDQMMSLAWFSLGSALGLRWGWSDPVQRFGIGFCSYALYTAGIRVAFWVNVLPLHRPDPSVPIGLMVMSLVWMVIIWRYRAVLPVMAMHGVVDFITIGHLHFDWFGS